MYVAIGSCGAEAAVQQDLGVHEECARVDSRGEELEKAGAGSYILLDVVVSGFLGYYCPPR